MSSSDLPRGVGPFLAVLSGLLLALAFPRPALYPLGWIALVPLLVAVRGATAGVAIVRGYLCGVAFFAVLLYWIAQVVVTYGGLTWFLGFVSLSILVLYLSTYFALFGVLVAGWTRRFGWRALLMSPVLWVGLELVRGRLMGGFPWGNIGSSQSPNLPLLQSASLGGVYAVSFLVVMANVGTTLLLFPGRSGSLRTRGTGAMLLAVFLAVQLAGVAVLRRADDTDVSSDRVRVGVVQANVSQEKKWDRTASGMIVNDLLKMTLRAAESGVDIIVWPESSSPLTFRRPVPVPGEGVDAYRIEAVGAFADRVTGLARNHAVELIAGSVDYRLGDEGLVAYNSAFLIDADGNLGPTYDKVHLVPFGEYVPLQRILFFVDRMVQGAIANFAAGERLAPLPTRAGPAATVICYEAVFPALVRDISRDAAFIVNITNDAWFGTSAGPYQHLASAVVRSVENRRYMVRAANTGISAFIDPYGRIVDSAPLGEKALLFGFIVPRHDRSLYARTGDVLAWSCVILTTLSLAALSAAFSRSGYRSRSAR